MLLVRLTTTCAVREMYDNYRQQKWAGIQTLSSSITETAVSIGYTSYNSLITEARNFIEPSYEVNFVNDYWLSKDVQLLRRD